MIAYAADTKSMDFASWSGHASRVRAGNATRNLMDGRSDYSGKKMLLRTRMECFRQSDPDREKRYRGLHLSRKRQIQGDAL